MEFTEEQKYKLLTLADYISKFLTDRGVKPSLMSKYSEGSILVTSVREITLNSIGI